ncbi:exonuclease [Streptomyces sp. CB03234]|uniref:AAA family ATPase n=1 Tax=Streptomyces sp. (strain CB03234) TaxID=1703937 RepID=UPI000938FB41|nr:SMC family ATPase [Streptomyces sp. CB03234]OKK03274.1 exonuclease [Streptomyces sp. CB03234]
MRLHRLDITGFGPFGTTQTVDFDVLSEAGLFLLHGPTGAGKTSVLDAVCYALYGAVPGARQSPGTSLRSDHAPAGTYTEVVLDLTVAGRRLEITRRPAQPRPKKRGGGFTTEKAQSWLREYDPQSGSWKGLSRSHQEIGEEVTQLLGMSREQFCQVVLLPQGDFARFLRADAEARGKLLGRLFDTRRFAAVEERLAELRRAAEQQVKDGDERLLALAHRMAQAAGGAADGWPAPEAKPGDPGLAGSVLAWAAVARSGAREALDVAESALLAADSRRAAARRALDEERELAARQQRYGDARRRGAELDARRGERDGWQARLERARKAERVAGPLSQRDDVEREHRAAREAHERAAAGLPPDLADAGAEHLTALAGQLREDLGGLDTARRAERRAAELARERGELDRQDRADEETLQDAAVWLAGWDTTRRDLQGRVEAAQEAATRAEHLAGRLDHARRRLAAARRRDALVRDVTAAASRLTAAREHANAAHETWLDLRERRLRGIAAELAAGLVDGEPCAVCGSADHPAPARADADHVDRTTEDAAYEAHARADEARSAAERGLAVTEEALTAARAEVADLGAPQHGDGLPGGAAPGRQGPAVDAVVGDGQAAPGPVGPRAAGVDGAAAPTDGAPGAGRPAAARQRGGAAPAGHTPSRDGAPDDDGVTAAADAGALGRARVAAAACAAALQRDGVTHRGVSGEQPTVEELAAEVAWLQREYDQARAVAAGMHAAREALEHAEREYQRRVEVRQQVERRAAARTSQREALDREQAVVDAELARVPGGAVAEHAAFLEHRIARLAEAAGTVRTVEDTSRRLKEADDRLADAAFRAGFDTPAAAAAALLDDVTQRDLQRRLDAWQAEAAAVADRLAEPETRAAAERPPADPHGAEAAHAAADRAARDADSALAAHRERCAELDRLSRQVATEVRRLGPLREEYERVARLAGLTAGTSAENERKMRLESYVLAARLEQVAAAATARLQRMSSGRYTLVHSDARAGAKRAGLGLHVVDAWTGSERDTATLSGGETFFASLALALGLADVVTDEAGGVRLDTLFIDEGFGSLDDQTLDEVLDVLDSLRERDRSVGIVSHVADLRRRVPTQLEVVKERGGSAVKLRAGGGFSG